jgi:hypothetical protein
MILQEAISELNHFACGCVLLVCFQFHDVCKVNVNRIDIIKTGICCCMTTVARDFIGITTVQSQVVL